MLAHSAWLGRRRSYPRLPCVCHIEIVNYKGCADNCALVTGADVARTMAALSMAMNAPSEKGKDFRETVDAACACISPQYVGCEMEQVSIYA